jgi:hypothetical protein
MPAYKFHVLNDTSYAADDTGTELANIDAAHAHARQILGDVIAEELRAGRKEIHLCVMVDDDEGERVANFRSATTLAIGLSPFAQ